MSRCFPFPPPGYEEKFKAENLDLLTKEKHREKKHKKEKKDKEKREHKEKKEKDRNKDKHKEKKDRKEKHKDRKKSKDIDKGLTPEVSGVENRTEFHNELQVQGSWQKAEEGKDSKLAEELGRRTRDDGVANQLVGSITRSFQKAEEGKNSKFEEELGRRTSNDTNHLVGSNARSWQKAEEGKNSKFEEELGRRTRDDTNHLVGSNTRSWQKAEDFKDSKFADELGRRTRDEGTANQLVGNITRSLQKAEEGTNSKFAEELGRRTRDDGAANHLVGSNARSLQKAEEGTNSKFAEELGRRTRDDGAANHFVGSITSSYPRKFEAVGPLLEKESGNGKKLLPAHIGPAQRNSGSGLPFEKVPNSLQRRAEFIGTAISTEKERSKMHEKVTVGISTEPNRNHAISRPDNNSWLANKKTGSSTTGMEKERSLFPKRTVSPVERGQLGEKVTASSSASSQKRNNIMGKPAENISLCSKPEVMANSPVLRTEGVLAVPSKAGKMFSHPFSSEQRTKASIAQPMEMDRYHKLDGKVTYENKKDDSVLSDKKIKRKDADRHSYEKETEEKIAKARKVEIDKTRNFRKKDQADTLNSKPLAPHKDNTAGIREVDASMKKRKDFKANGFLHENDARPSKMPRLNSSSEPPVNDQTPELLPDPPFRPSPKDGAVNNLKPVRTLDNNVKRINGTANSPQLPAEARPAAARSPLENGDVSSKLPHPDSLHLHHIYTVPKMEAWSEVDDLDWLFSRRNSLQKLKAKHEAESAAQVWAEALRIDSADVFALPYVVPF